MNKYIYLGISTFLIWCCGFCLSNPWASVVHFIGAYFSFVTIHDATHKVVPEIFGYLSAIPLLIPYKEFSLLHRMHHSNVNDAERDPDHIMQHIPFPSWFFVPEIYLVFYWRKHRIIPNSTPGRAFINYSAMFAVWILGIVIFGVSWTAVHLLPSRLALMCLVYLLDVLPHRNSPEDQTRNLWNEDKAPLLFEIITQKQCYHKKHHDKPFIATLDL